jgi:isopenicillin N synthase-like dioxygenase
MTAAVPVVDIGAFLAGDIQGSAAQCTEIANSLREYGCVVVRDPRVTEKDNNDFLDLLEAYFAQSDELKLKDARPEYHFQVGVTPSGVELPRDHTERIKNNYVDMCRPHNPIGPDPKWRYFWRIGDRPEVTEFEGLNAAPVVPEAFPQWPAVMDRWGTLMLTSVTAVSEMLALGLGLSQQEFSNRMKQAPHLLAPTASDLVKYGEEKTVLAGFHYDLNFLTIHGKSRFPGLNIFLRDGSDAPYKKLGVKVPDGCLLIQAGKQLEWLTGGHIQAGFHEVVVSPATVERIEAQRKADGSLWRISSTLFSHIASDQVLEPLGPFNSPSSAEKYPQTKAGTYVTQELTAIKLKCIPSN